MLDTRTSHDGYQVNRRHRCANDHVFRTVQMLEAANSAKRERNAQVVVAAKNRARIWARNDRIRKRLAEGHVGAHIAADEGVSIDIVSMIKRGKL